jgi:hypothetical protein
MKAPCIKPHLNASSILGLALAFNALAQAPRPPQLESPVVHPDRSVTFSFRAPNAKKVELSAQFLRGNQPVVSRISNSERVNDLRDDKRWDP